MCNTFVIRFPVSNNYHLFLFWISLLFCSVCSQNAENKLNVENCIKIALKNSPYIIKATSEQLQTRNNVFTSLSTVLPQFQVASQYAKTPANNELVINPEVNPSITDIVTNDNFELSFTISQSIVDVASWIQLKQTGTISRSAEFTFTASKADLIYNVKQAFYELIRLYRNTSVSQSSVDQSIQQVLVAEERFRLGAISKPELLRIQTGLSQFKVELMDAKNNLENGRRNLINYLGITSFFQIDTTVEFPDTSSAFPSEDSLIKMLLLKNPEFNSLKLNLDAQKQSNLAVKLQKIPTLNGFFTFGYTGSHLFSNLSDFWSLGVQLNWPVFEGLRWYGQLKESSIQIKTTEADLEITRNSAIQQMHQALNNLKINRESLSMVKLLIEQAAEEFRLRQEQYRLGATSSVELLTSQVAFNQAHQQAIQIITAYYLADAQIKRLLGEW